MSLATAPETPSAPTTMDARLVERLREIATVRLGEPLGRHTTFGIGGPADVFVTVRNADQLAQTVRAVRDAGVPVFILGSGSNILIGDGGVRGVVIDNQAKAVRVGPLQIDDGVTLPSAFARDEPAELRAVWAESGTSFAALARRLGRDGIGGIEWAAGIPGTLGGAAVYNAGAYGGSLSDVVLSAMLLDADGNIRSVPAGKLGLSYRSSVLLRGERPGAIVLAVELVGHTGDAGEIMARIDDIDAQRLAAQPRGRTGGSTFKNPPGHHAWELIDAVGLRGYRVGDAQISEKHCNFFMNVGAARAADVANLMEEARRRVKEHYGIVLENEVELIGEGFA
jgi:UDP-N-acetylmuramate dehydrogenase